MPKGIQEFSAQTTPQTYHFRHTSAPPSEQVDRINTELRQRGASTYNMWLPETHYIPYLIHHDEHIMGSTYGRYKAGRGVLVATNQRVLFVDKKPLFTHVDEITFAIIGGVTYSRGGIFGHVILHTRLGDYDVRTMNHKNAANFVDYIETQCLQNAYKFQGTGYNSLLM